MKQKLPNISQTIINKAIEIGFDACGISASRELTEYADNFNNWLANGYNAEMQYMANNIEKRLNPALLHEGTKSIITVLLNYYPSELQNANTYQIAKYAYGKDYHFVVKEKLNLLAEFINNNIEPINGRAFVDSAPVLDQIWAVESGLGWIGKNSLLINKKLGSFFFIGHLFVDIELENNNTLHKNYCGSCTRCIDSCPTGAIVANGIIDANKCISYQTIEKKGEISPEVENNISNRIFGCDICQDVCPWNKKSKPNSVELFTPNPKLITLDRAEWENISHELFNEIFRKSAVKRAGFLKFTNTIKSIRSNKFD
ncbi:MAG: tRNA epoxyqueuosine(34) reductase QueG [Bacteroidales bacterium]|nr:tRNA epoxyqueuosine(34) reductase QueG [Bacteroidales bacterium]